MPVTIEQLNKKYQTEDTLWDFKLFFSWLSKKGISQGVITATLRKVLADFTVETLPEKHHDFDNAVKDIALELKDNAETIMMAELEKSVVEGYAKYEEEWNALGNNALGKMKKIWEVLRGRA